MGAAEVLGDARFMLMIVVYSGFWILYFQNFGTVLYYLRDFVDSAPVSAALTSAFQAVGLPWTFTFDAEHVTVINAGTIILLQVLVSRIVKNRPALATMVTGMAIGALGFLCLAASLNAWVFVLGIAVFSIGEMTAHPKYYSFVGLVAPADRKAVYMGYAFLYGVFGSLIGANLGSYLLRQVHDAGHRHAGGGGASPGSSGCCSRSSTSSPPSLLIVFAKRFGQDTPATRRSAWLVMFVVYAAVGLLGVYFLFDAFSGETPQYRTAVQALIFLALGSGGLVINAIRRP